MRVERSGSAIAMSEGMSSIRALPVPFRTALSHEMTESSDCPEKLSSSCDDMPLSHRGSRRCLNNRIG